MKTINGYTFDEKKWVMLGGNGQSVIATKNGNKYFLKRLGDPKYPPKNSDRAFYLSESKRCDEWLAYRNRIVAAMPGKGIGNIVKPLEYFTDGTFFYEAALYVETKGISYKDVWKEEPKTKARIMLTVTMALSEVHNAGIIHGDLDPGNILISRSPSGNLVTKLIDFTNAFFTKEIPDEIVSKEYWMSPEIAGYILQKENRIKIKKIISTKADVYSLGIIFHQYCTRDGRGPSVRNGEHPFQDSIKDGSIQIDRSIEPAFKDIIKSMTSVEPSDRPTLKEVQAQLKKIMDGSIDVKATSQPLFHEEEKKKVTPKGKEIKVLNTSKYVKAAISPKNPAKVELYKRDGSIQLMDLNLARGMKIVE